MKKVIIIAVLLAFALIISGCKVVQVQPEPIEQENQTLTLSNLSISEPCPSGTTFLSNFMKGYQCQPTDNIRDCEAGGGSWKLFSNGCGDSCGQKPRMCTQAFKAACDCGTTTCFNGTSCVADLYEPYATPQEACKETNGTWQKMGERCPTIEEVRVLTTIPSFPDESGRCSVSNIFCGGMQGGKCPNAETCTYGLCETECSSSNSIKIGVCPVQRMDVIGCKCQEPLTFGLQGCKEYNPETNKLMSVVGGWN